jgi:hypothetical protein
MRERERELSLFAAAPVGSMNGPINGSGLSNQSKQENILKKTRKRLIILTIQKCSSGRYSERVATLF